MTAIESRHRTPVETRAETHCLSGWGESVHGWARVWRPTCSGELVALVRGFAQEGRKFCLRGAGRSYGDAALGTGLDVIDLRGLDEIRSFDPETGTAVCEAGVTIEQLCHRVIGTGWWPQVVPGTMRPTIGGCVAMNVHGKNQFRVGTFGDSIEELDVVMPDGSRRLVTPGDDPELFSAFLGGFGMLGVVVAVRLRLKRVHSGQLEVTAAATPDLGSMIRMLREAEATSDYLVGWVDCYDRRGRGVVHLGRHLGEGEDPHPEQTLDPAAQEVPARLFGVLPTALLGTLILPFGCRAGMRFVNRAKYWAGRLRGRHSFRQSHGAFAFLLDYVPGWKRIHDPGGLIQYQSFVPLDKAHAVYGELLGLCRDARLVPWLGVLKRHADDDYLMSHNVDGFSLALDFTVNAQNRAAVWDLCRRMDEVVLAGGGRFYLAKDATLTRRSFGRAYAGIERFREIKRELDPDGLLVSDLAIRLGIVEAPPPQ